MKTGAGMVMLVLSMLLATFACAAGDAASGREKSALCAGCHGANGISISPMIPNLAAQKEDYLVKTIKDFRAGKRKNPIMMSVAQGLSDADIANLAAFFSGLTLSAQ